MGSDFFKLKQELLAKHCAILMAQFQAIAHQRDTTTDAGLQVILQAQLDTKESEIKKVEQELEQLAKSSTDTNQRLNYFESKLLEINCEAAMCIVEDIILERFGVRGGTCLFLIQKSDLLGGDLLRKRIRKTLNDTNGRVDPLIEVNLHSDPEVIDLLDALASYFAVMRSPESTDEQYAQVIIEKISKSIISRNKTVYIEINKWEAFFSPETKLLWFLENFWMPLIDVWDTLSTKLRNIRFIGVLSVDSELSREALASCLICDPKQFEKDKLIELPLEYWREDEIVKWLIDHSQGKLSDEKLIEIAKHIYRNSYGGMPSKIQPRLFEYCK